MTTTENTAAIVTSETLFGTIEAADIPQTVFMVRRERLTEAEVAAIVASVQADRMRP